MYRTRSTVWNHFNKISSITAKCNYCSSVYSVKGGSTANLLRHIRTKHPTVNMKNVDINTTQAQEREEAAQVSGSDV